MLSTQEPIESIPERQRRAHRIAHGSAVGQVRMIVERRRRDTYLTAICTIQYMSSSVQKSGAR
jgi:hypothetical protein